MCPCKKKSTDPKLLNGSVLFICVMWKLLTQAFQFTIGVYESNESSAFLEMGVIRHLVRAVDFGSMLKQQLNDLCMASSCRPYDGVNTVLLGQTQINYTPQKTLKPWDEISYRATFPPTPQTEFLMYNKCLYIEYEKVLRTCPVMLGFAPFSSSRRATSTRPL